LSPTTYLGKQVSAASPLLSGGSKRASPENREGKKKQPIPGRDQPLAPKTHTVLETRKPKGKKNECEATFKRIISPRQFCQEKPTAERKTHKVLKNPKTKSKKVSSTRQPQQQQITR